MPSTVAARARIVRGAPSASTMEPCYPNCDRAPRVQRDIAPPAMAHARPTAIARPTLLHRRDEPFPLARLDVLDRDPRLAVRARREEEVAGDRRVRRHPARPEDLAPDAVACGPGRDRRLELRAPERRGALAV